MQGWSSRKLRKEIKKIAIKNERRYTKKEQKERSGRKKNLKRKE